MATKDIGVLTILACLAAGPSASAAPTAAPVTVRVVDQATGTPLPYFTYSWWTEQPGQQRERTRNGVSTNGQFEAATPARCELNVYVEGPDLLGGYGRNHASFLVSETNRAFVFKAERGTRVRGRVVAADTGEPVAGAEVRPMVFMPPLFVMDRERAAATDAEGRFELPGVDAGLGIGVAHRDFADWESAFDFKPQATNADGSLQVEIKLDRGGVLEGRVVDAAGQPLAGAEVESGDGKQAATDAQGRFRLVGLAARRDGMLRVALTGYVEHRRYDVAAQSGPLRIVLERQPVVRGLVRDPEGRPVAGARIWGGPDAEPKPYACSEARSGADGRFAVTLEEREGTNWLGVAAPGFAPWFTQLRQDQLGDDVICTLVAGTTVQLTLATNAATRGAVAAQLRRHRAAAPSFVNADDPSQQQELATFHAKADAQGRVRFDHVGPGRYRLTLRGPACTPYGRDVVVGTAPLDLGAVRLRGTGAIIGRIHASSREPVGTAYTKGEIYYQGVGLNPREEDPPLAFTADARGLFRVDHVPAGEVSVNLPYMATADIRDAVTRRARVVEGRTTEVVFFGPASNHLLRVRLHLGDDSIAAVDAATGRKLKPAVQNVTDRKPMFLLELTPRGDEAAAWESADWQELGAAGTLALRDVQPGPYRLRLYDWHGSIGLRHRLAVTNVTVTPAMGEIVLRLGAGSMAGTLVGTGAAVNIVHLLAVPHTAPPGVRETWSDGEGRFCLRYLEPGSYRLRAHDHEAGWADLGEVTVGNGIARCAGRPLQPGSSLRVQVEGGTGEDIAVVDEAGRMLEASWRNEEPGLAFHHLWPGRWTVVRGEGRVALTNVAVEAGSDLRVVVGAP